MSDKLPLPRRNDDLTYVPPPMKCQTLAHYATNRVVMSHESKLWPFIRRWQLAGLVSVRPINRRSARVTLTQAGRARVKSETGASS